MPNKIRQFKNTTGNVTLKRVCLNCKFYTREEKYCVKNDANEPVFGFCWNWSPSTYGFSPELLKNYRLERT